VALDLTYLYALDDVGGAEHMARAAALSGQPQEEAQKELLDHWVHRRHDVQHAAWKHLVVGSPRVIIHARPLRPLQPKLDWDERVP
jgi:hypothetical protein